MIKKKVETYDSFQKSIESTVKVISEDKNLNIWNEGLDQKKVSVLKIPTFKKPFDLHISAYTNKKVNNKDVLFDFEQVIVFDQAMAFDKTVE